MGGEGTVWLVGYTDPACAECEKLVPIMEEVAKDLERTYLTNTEGGILLPAPMKTLSAAYAEVHDCACVALLYQPWASLWACSTWCRPRPRSWPWPPASRRCPHSTYVTQPPLQPATIHARAPD